MTELETIAQAQNYIYKLAQGINPLDNTPIPEDDLINHIKISRCFFFTADVLRRVVENGGISAPDSRKKTRTQKLPFAITHEQRDSIEISEYPVTISEIVRRLNMAVNNPQMQRISYSDIAEWLTVVEIFETIRQPSGEERRQLKSFGKDIGFTTEIREGHRGTYQAIVLDQEGQKFILDNLDAIIALSEKNHEFQWKPWTKEMEEQLIQLYQNGACSMDLVNVFKRRQSSIRSRIRKLEQQGRLG